MSHTGLRHYLSASFCLLSTVFLAQSPHWLEHFGNGDPYLSPFRLSGYGESAVYAFGSFEGPAISVGAYSLSDPGSVDLLLVKLDTAGSVLWAKTAGGDCEDDAELSVSIGIDPNGDRLVITGRHNCDIIHFDGIAVPGSGTLNPHDGFLAAYDSAGTALWATSAEGYDVRPGEVLLDAAHNTFWFGGIVTAGASFNGDVPIVVQPGGFVAKYDAGGELIYAERWLTKGIIENADRYDADEWVLSGRGSANAALLGQNIGLESAFQDAWVARVDTSGSLIWVVPILSDSNAYAHRCAAGPAGDVVVLGGFQGSAVFGADTLHGNGYAFEPFLGSYSSSGELNWAYRLSGGSYTAAFDMERASDGSIYVLGEFMNELVLPGMAPLAASTERDMFVARFDAATGLCQSAYHYGKVGSGYGQSYGSVWPTAHGIYVADCYDSTFTVGANVYEPSSVGATDLFVARFDTLAGYTGVSSLALEEGELHIYANPNKGTCMIDLPEQLRYTADLALLIYDQQGQLVQRVPMRYTTEGVALDISAQAKGIYHVELGDGKQRYTGTIVFE